MQKKAHPFSFYRHLLATLLLPSVISNLHFFYFSSNPYTNCLYVDNSSSIKSNWSLFTFTSIFVSFFRLLNEIIKLAIFFFISISKFNNPSIYRFLYSSIPVFIKFCILLTIGIDFYSKVSSYKTLFLIVLKLSTSSIWSFFFSSINNERLRVVFLWLRRRLSESLPLVSSVKLNLFESLRTWSIDLLTRCVEALSYLFYPEVVWLGWKEFVLR